VTRVPCLLLFGLTVVLGAAPAVAASACDVILRPDGNTAAIQHAMDRAAKRPTVVCLHAGTYAGARLTARRAVTLRRIAQGPVVLDAGSQGRVLTVTGATGTIRLEGLTLRGGKADRGGAILHLSEATLRLEDCTVTANVATLLGGGAIAADAGSLVLVRTRIHGNQGERASALDLGGTVKARLVSTLISDNAAQGLTDPPIRLRGAGQLEIVASTVAYNGGSALVVQPEGDGPRRLVIESSILLGKPDALTVPRAEAETVRVERSVVYGQIGYVPLDLASARTLPGFALKPPERYQPEVGSAAIALGRCTANDARRDLLGRPRAATCTAGALEAPPADVRKTLAERKKSAPKASKPTTWKDL
jgi:predicted outer membrane repeat protein